MISFELFFGQLKEPAKMDLVSNTKFLEPSYAREVPWGKEYVTHGDRFCDGAYIYETREEVDRQRHVIVIHEYWGCRDDSVGSSGPFSSGGPGGGGVGGGDTADRLRKKEIEDWWERNTDCHKFLDSAQFAGDPDVGMVTGECVFDKWHRMRLVRTFCEMLKLLNRNQRDNTIYNCLIAQWETYVIVCDDRPINPRFDGRYVSTKHPDYRSIYNNYFSDEVEYNLAANVDARKAKRLHLSYGQLQDHQGILGLMLANCYGTKVNATKGWLFLYQLLASMLLRTDDWKNRITCDLLKRLVEKQMKDTGVDDEKSISVYVKEICERGPFWAYSNGLDDDDDDTVFRIDLCNGTVFIPRRDANNEIIEEDHWIEVATFPSSHINLINPSSACDFMRSLKVEGLDEDLGYEFIRMPFVMAM